MTWNPTILFALCVVTGSLSLRSLVIQGGILEFSPKDAAAVRVRFSFHSRIAVEREGPSVPRRPRTTSSTHLSCRR